MRYPPGKLPNPVLEQMLARADRMSRDPRILVGPRVGEDAAALDFGENCLIVATDPVTFATDQLGWYVVQVNANDVAVRGAQPQWLLVVLLLPEKDTDDALVTTLFEQIYDACDSLGCELIGGHTEITFGIERPIAVGQMIGEVPRAKLVTTGGAQVGDALLLTKGIAIEGTALLAREQFAALRAHGVSEELLARARDLLFRPGLSIVRDALTANAVATIHAMHDPTEGGLATGVAELAHASNVGVILEHEAIRVLPECETICAALGLDPLGTLASGALLLAVAPEDSTRVMEALARENITCAQIGELVHSAEGLKMRTRVERIELPSFARDEVTRVFER
jgi:hydrogenase maturation factor